MPAGSSGKHPRSGLFLKETQSAKHKAYVVLQSNNRDVLLPVKKATARVKSIELKLSHSSQRADETRTAMRVSSGVLIDEIRDGSKILVPSKSSRIKDPLVERIQIRLNQLLLEKKYGGNECEAVEVNGFFSSELGSSISFLRRTLPNPPYEPGDHIDAALINFLFPCATRTNLENKLIRVNSGNANLGEFPLIIKELQGHLNSFIPEARLLENGQWSGGLNARIKQFQANNLIRPTGEIDAATYKLLKGAKIKDLVAQGDAILVVSAEICPAAVSFIKLLQTILNKYLKTEITVDGIFSEATASFLETAQKAAGVKERRVFGKESFDALSAIIKNEPSRSYFFTRLRSIELGRDIASGLDDKEKSESLLHKMLDVQPEVSLPENGISQSLKALGIDLHSTEGISEFQRKRELPVDGRINKATSQQIYELLSAMWIKKKVVSSGFAWRDGVNELNAIGLRGWSPQSGSNDNAADEWNDTIAFVWKDARRKMRFIEYCATTDPGVVEKVRSKQEAHSTQCMQEGQYRYILGHFHGQSGAAVPLSTKECAAIPKSFFYKLKSRLSTFILGSHPFIIRWMEISVGIDNIETVGQLAHGSQVPKISKSQFKKEITPLFKRDPSGYFLYSLINLSKK